MKTFGEFSALLDGLQFTPEPGAPIYRTEATRLSVLAWGDGCSVLAIARENARMLVLERPRQAILVWVSEERDDALELLGKILANFFGSPKAIALDIF